jgi:uncharacterized protein YjbI with pentapeptide repeats
MANKNHEEILRQGWRVWYRWHTNHPDEKLDLKGSYFSEIDLGSIDLNGVDLSQSHFYKVKFEYTNLRKANLSGASLQHCSFSSGSLLEANLSGADLFHTQFHDVDLREADFEGCFCGYTIFANVDLSTTKGLEKVNHYSASTLGFDTLVLSRGKISDHFLRGCGISDNLIHNLPSFVQEATQYNSCLLMYHQVDKVLVERLYNRLQAAGVRCWRYGREYSHGNKNRQSVNLFAGDSYQKIIMCCSETTFQTMWLSSSIDRLIGQENLQEQKKLMSLDLDGSLVTASKGRRSYDVMQDRLILPYRDWKDDANFDLLVDAVVKALRSDTSNPAN